MFDFAWSEIAVIAVVALIAIGPKDMPHAIRAITGAMKKARRMASEFQSHVDDMVREANLGEVRDQISSIRNFDIKSHIERAVDPDGSLRTTFASNPLAPTPLTAGSFASSATGSATETTVLEGGDVAVAERPYAGAIEPAPSTSPEDAEASQAAESQAALATQAPAFIPPGALQPAPAMSALPDAPAFIPPGIAAQHPSPRAL